MSLSAMSATAARSLAALLASLAVLGLVGLASAEVQLTEDQIALMKQLRAACIAETGVDEPSIEACKSGKFADDQKLKCYMKCTFQQMTVMDDDGLVDADMLLTMLPEELQAKAGPVLNTCKDKRGADSCENAMLFSKCIYDMAPEFYMVV